MNYTIQDIAAILAVDSRLRQPATIRYLLTDSRRVTDAGASLFFALQSAVRDGHAFIESLYRSGVRNFVVREDFDTADFPEANFLFAPQGALQCLQQLAAYHRSRFNYPVIGITGSNGKTIVKEWLYQLLQSAYTIVRSPRSYNSQVGVPLSVWQMTPTANLAIFEAGISEPGEMEKLEPLVQPTIGVLTNIGSAHDEGFTGRVQKLQEKLQLFRQAQSLVFPYDDPLVREGVAALPVPVKLGWGKAAAAPVQVKTEDLPGGTRVHLACNGTQQQFDLPFSDEAAVSNAISCWCVAWLLGHAATAAGKMAQLQPVDMRMQLRKAINDCVVIDDSYSFDAVSLNIALDFLQQQPNSSKTVILSDLPVIAGVEEYQEMLRLLHSKHISHLLAIGEQWSDYSSQLGGQPFRVQYFRSTQDFLNQFLPSQFREQAILIKGARVFGFEAISRLFDVQVHQTVLEVNLTAMAHNLKAYRKLLAPGTRLMAMVKAFGYGSGSAEIASLLQYQKVDYLAVAYADEGVELRKAGISLPVMVMNADRATFDALVDYSLEPELYSFAILQEFAAYLEKEGLQQYPVHLKLDTGMHRLGFEEADMPALKQRLQSGNTFRVRSVFSHLAGSEDPALDAFTREQVSRFQAMTAQLELPASVIRHIANTSGILRHPYAQLDMVRLGIGLYGVDSSYSGLLPLQTVATLKTTIAQIRQVKAGETVGYNRRGVLTRDSVIATLRIGYADGVSRLLGNGAGQVAIRGHRAPVTGSVCMDMLMADVTDIPGVQEGDEAEIFGRQISVKEVADWCKTIPYEILTSIQHRVKRVYIEE